MKESQFSMDLFYNREADTTVRLNDGKLLKFNRAAFVITISSKILDQIFFGGLRNPDITDILDFDYDCFKLFLDCVMGFKEFTFHNSFEIFPIVWKYQVENLIEKCINSLKQEAIDEMTIKILNMAAYQCCNALVNQTTNLINKKFINFYQFFEDYHSKLNPEAMKELLAIFTKKEVLDSQMIEDLLLWGDNYIKNNNTGCDKLQIFFRKCDLLKFFTLECFETTGAMAKFCLSGVGKNLFSTSQILSYIQNSKKLVLGNSEWRKFEDESTLVEEIIIIPTIKQHSEYLDVDFDDNVFIEIESNNYFFYDPAPNCDIYLTIKIIGKDSLDCESEIYESPESWCNISDSSDCAKVIEVIEMNLSQFLQCSSYTLQLIWEFKNRGRALLKSFPGNNLNSSDKMYFVKHVCLDVCKI